MNPAPLALTSLCLATALGAGQDETWEAIRTGRSALKPCEFDSLPVAAYAGAVPALDHAALTGEWAAFDCRNNRLAELALQQDGFAEAVARGLSNKEIAAEFGVSARTIEMHISHILAKKGWSNRVEIARDVLRRPGMAQRASDFSPGPAPREFCRRSRPIARSIRAVRCPKASTTTAPTIPTRSGATCERASA